MPRSGDALGEECRIPFIGPLKGGENAAYTVSETLKGKNVAWRRTPHTPFRRHSRPLGQAYAPSEVSGILFVKNLKILSLFLQLVLRGKDSD